MSERLTQVTIVDKEVHKLLPGEMARHPFDQCWYLGCPDPTCKVPANLGNHTVTISEGLVTVSPSILHGCGAHYFVERSQIRWC